MVPKEAIAVPEEAYAEVAYTPDRLRRRSEGECHHSRKFRTFAAGGESLVYRNPSVDISPMHGWQHNTPKELREREADPAMARFEDPEYRVDQPLRWDEECIRFTSHTKRAFFFGMARVLGLGGLFFAFPVFLATTTFLAIDMANQARYGGFFSNFFSFHGWLIPFIAFAISFILWSGAALVQRFSPYFAAGMQPGPMWELNRRTGEVTVFTDPSKKRTAWQVEDVRPFYEFDCYLLSTPDPQGSPQYSLSLVHHLDEVQVRLVGMFGATQSHLEQRANWDMLQRYMDVSQPLPDFPMLEQDRPADPTTREHDRYTGRDPRFWRDMDDATYERYVEAQQGKINALYL
ncbi:hypothetical protein SAMN05216571_101290 [Onishia taeanensis]|uniref:Uncharacterized protein n=1 Tax=Onishia taeanensis TaxID=284577 RepID=A0A1G7N8Y2_9GAMM|nr:hypothetical protein [Halomonas taeanensis]SDF70357.1 hypothetical protein SAMN05216571_101290 [Halomonas taeanensis]